MGCTIFKKTLFSDSEISDFEIDDSLLSSLIPPFNASYSGIWRPIIIKSEDSTTEYTEILHRAETEQGFFDPCNCSSAGIQTFDTEAEELDCSYCTTSVGNSHSIAEWRITDQISGKSVKVGKAECCEGACDVRITKDDYLAKLPVLNSTYLTKFYDWKYKKQFPACANLGLGMEKIAYSTTHKSFADGPELVIDWIIKERISEIPPNDIDSYHQHIDSHEKSYKRSLISSKTCGNFILTKLGANHTNNPPYPLFSGIISDITTTGNFSKLLPSPQNFTKPYGFKNQDHYNIFVKTEKVGSYWKWNYTSGILCWYRYFDKDKENDCRVIPGVDLYISDGDVFYAKNDGPEDSSNNFNEDDPELGVGIHSCPSGLKLIKNSTVTGVLPNDSEFIYISENIYSKFYTILNKLEDLEVSLDTAKEDKMSPIDKMNLAALLSTGPNYHEVTIDLLKTVLDLDDPEKDYKRDDLKQIEVFNSGMLNKQQVKLNKLNLVKTKEDLINTLANKYGAYIWCPPNSTTNLELKKDYDPHGYIDLNFEPVVKERDTFFSSQCRDTPADCAENTVFKTFAYDQKIGVGNFVFRTDVDKRYKTETCLSGVFTIDRSANIISAYFNDGLIKEAYYGSGCTVFYQKYLRVPSYDLAYEKVGDSLCKDYEVCDERLARIYNKTPGQFEDKSVILNRKYPANYCNPNIDRIGFNKQGGLYYDSNIFGSGNIVFSSSASSSKGKYFVEFKTKDIGIKIYNLEIFKLRDDDNPQCKTFPLDQACKCFPLIYADGFRHNCNDNSLVFTNSNNILYTPNISTQNSPKIKSYGGFSSVEVKQILGTNNTIENHPEPGEELEVVNRIIDPLNPYGCSESIVVNFPNYVYTKWSITLPKQYNTSHADVWMKINENADLFRPTKVVMEDDDFSVVPNPNYRRYTTKAKVKDKILYGGQQDILFEKNSSTTTIDIELTNPFLFQLLSQLSTDIDLNKKLYTPLPCSLDVNRNQENPFDPYLTQAVSFTFRRIPRKQILGYKLKPLTSMGTLQKGFFHPNSGLISDEVFFNKTSLVFNTGLCSFDFDYERKIFASGAGYSGSGIIFTGTITSGVGRILDSTNSLLNHKRTRLYIQHNDKWYEYLNPNVFGYFNPVNQEVYPGHPLYFEYAKEDKYKTQISTTKCIGSGSTEQIYETKPSVMIPASVKDNIKFTYFHNVKNTGHFGILPNNDYPIFNETFTVDKNSNNKILIPGTRAYFMLEEDDFAIEIKGKIEDMEEILHEEIRQNTFIVDGNGNRWRYKGEGPKNNEDSYESVLPRSYRDSNFSEGFIDYTNSNKRGYIANTNLRTKISDLELIDIKDPKKTYKGKVKSKSLFAPKSDKYGNEISKFNSLKPNSYLQVYTLLELDNICENCDIPIKEGYIKLINPTGEKDKKYGESFVVYQDFQNMLKLEREYLLSNKYVQTKWGDLIGFDKKTNSDLSNSKTINEIIERAYPKTLYKNILHNITLNNLDTGNFVAMIVTNDSLANTGETSGIISYTGPVYYNIHQIYNIGLDRYIENIIEQYQNYLPYIDINFLDSRDIKKNNVYINLENNYKNNKPSNGNIYISGIRCFTDTKILENKPESGSSFFVSLDKNAYLRPVLFDKEFYYDTLRVDHVYYRLASLSKTEELDGAGCRQIYRPNIKFDNTTFTDYFDVRAFNTTSAITQSFQSLPIYCDVDKVSGCVVEACALKTRGYINLKAGYNHYEYPSIKADVLEKEDSINYCLSVDEGLYNVIGNESVPYIQRFEIEPKSNIFPDTTLDGTISCIEGVSSRPNKPQNYIDYEYQTKLKKYILDENNKGNLVKNTDILANEMLFRLIYGSKQKIGYDTIKKKTIEESIRYKNENSISYLLQYSTPRTTPDYIYKLIPYDYSNQSDTSKRKIQGSISINGVLKIGKTVSVQIEKSTISISIRKIDGKIYSIAECNGILASGLIHDEDRLQYEILGQDANFPPPLPSGPNQTIKLLQTCEIPETYTWSKGRYFTSMINAEGVDLVGEYLRCASKLGVDGPCVNQIDWGGNPPHPDVVSAGIEGCAGQPPCPGCLSRGYAPGPGQWLARGQVKDVLVGDPNAPNFGSNGGSASRGDLEVFDSIPPNCSVITSRSAKVTVGALGRGSFGAGSAGIDCAVKLKGEISTSLCQLGGDFDMVMGGLAVMNLFGHSNCVIKTPSCRGICTPLDFEDKFGKLNNPVRNKTGAFNGPHAICECSSYQFGYCAVPDSTCSCPDYFPGYPKIFTYDFEYCNYNFTNMRGHLWKYEDGEPPTWGGSPLNIGCEASNIEYGGPVGKATEECYWAECRFESSNLKLYERKTINPDPYNPLCPVGLCSIQYDNNVITLSMPGSQNTCFPNIIRNSCPEITITLPDSSFNFSDAITSECTECEVDQNAIKIPKSQTPEWDIITETRTAILNWMLPIEGDRNIDAIGGGGAVYVDKSYCGNTQPCCCDTCYAGTGGFMQCGRSAPDSWIWWHGLACNINGSPEPSFKPCKNRVTGVGMTNLMTGIGFYMGSDNPKVKSRVIADWRRQVTAIYKTYAPCFNHKDGSINIDDLVEGVIPGSCSELQFAVASYPIVAWRKTLDGGEYSDGSLGIHYAFFTYQYKRPRTIQDVFLGDNAIKCSTAVPIFPTDGYNITEKYEIKNCETVPTCHDDKPSVCDDERWCCLRGRLEDRKDI